MVRLLILFAVSFMPFQIKSADADLSPLRIFAGTWMVSRSGAPTGAKPDQLLNTCAAVGQYFTCQQNVNGKVSALLVFIPSGKTGHFYMQYIRTEGLASGRSNLQIDNDHWTFTDTRTEAAHTTYYRTVNVFTGKNHIHFEQSQSTDGTHWSVTGSGDEVRAAAK